jgi:hypothetical protein
LTFFRFNTGGQGNNLRVRRLQVLHLNTASWASATLPAGRA